MTGFGRLPGKPGQVIGEPVAKPAARAGFLFVQARWKTGSKHFLHYRHHHLRQDKEKTP
jgi:hypothetical protein